MELREVFEAAATAASDSDTTQQLLEQTRRLLSSVYVALQGKATRIGSVKDACDYLLNLIGHELQEVFVGSVKDACDYLLNLIGHELQEVFVVIAFNEQMHVLAAKEIYRGTTNSMVVAIADVMRVVVQTQCATRFMVAHNHPSGNPTPSSQDKEVCYALEDAAHILDLDFVDFIIIGGASVYSAADAGLLGHKTRH